MGNYGYAGRTHVRTSGCFAWSHVRTCVLVYKGLLARGPGQKTREQNQTPSIRATHRRITTETSQQGASTDNNGFST